MSVIATDKWLEESSQHSKISKKLKPYFPGQKENLIFSELLNHGVYRSSSDCEKLVRELKQQNTWGFIKSESEKLKRLWNGPDVPIFIFPSDMSSSRLKKDHGGKSGLAFNDKLFLFLTPEVGLTDRKALLIHEYHHVCRIARNPKREEDYTLEDVVILEGMAENAVRETLGEKPVAKWAKLYTEEQIKQIWNKHIEPNRKIRPKDQKFHKILYGKGFYPPMTGYAAGYYAVKKYMSSKSLTTKDMLSLPAEQIIRAVF
ncbi:DUF2268 domain-containing protein [Metabacillus sp. GX 13764]|uniref:DUF2268 domain-containing protein n=1 Tax=Metabacillus kandeliae TaxID=2900151 RepID=UPI001E4A4EA0|nr:DUF2268 domain-containing protein [Metabacillus kandeliae]MCD7034963.1 DUF2268 domain-containing protein [Metabacillus kandeliae]